MSIADQSWPRTQWCDGGVNVIRAELPAKDKIDLVLRIFALSGRIGRWTPLAAPRQFFLQLSEHRRT